VADNPLNEVADRLASLGEGELLETVELVAHELGMKGEELTKKLMTVRLKPRTGRLRASVNYKVKRLSNRIQLVLKAGGKRLPYLVTHEYGATIRMKSKYLRIPLPAAKTKAGVDRYSTPLRTTGAGLFYAAKSKRGNLLLFSRKTNKPWYILKKSVTIPRRQTIGLGFRYIEKNLAPELEKIILMKLESL
tara:strand:- start:294 stop:866 length:573 start_codon:yes stop_codon:yes gene_type:complete